MGLIQLPIGLVERNHRTKMMVVSMSALCAVFATTVVVQAEPLANAQPGYGHGYYGKREAEPSYGYYGYGYYGKRSAEPGHYGWYYGKRSAEPSYGYYGYGYYG